MDEGDRCDPWRVQCHLENIELSTNGEKRERERERERERGGIPRRCLYRQLRTQQIVPVVVFRLTICPVSSFLILADQARFLKFASAKRSPRDYASTMLEAA